MALIIEIQDSKIQVIEGRSRREGRFIVDAHFDINFQDSEGNESKTFIKDFKEKFKENKIRDTKAHIVFNNRFTLAKEFTLPRLDKRKMALIVKNEMQLSLNLDDSYVYDYLTLSTETQDGRQYERLLAFAIRTQHIQETEKWLKQIGISIRTIQTSTSTVINMLDFTDVVQDNLPVIVTDMQNLYTRFYLYYKQEIFMIRTVHPDIREMESSGQRFINLSKLLVNAIYNEHELVVDKIILLGNYDLILDVEENYANLIDIPVELATLTDAFINPSEDKYITFSSIGAIS